MRPEGICAEDSCGHLDCLTWWNTQALKAMTRHIARELEDYERIEAELDTEEPPL